MFRTHLKAHRRLLAFFMTKETPTHERIAVQNICMRSSRRLGEYAVKNAFYQTQAQFHDHLDRKCWHPIGLDNFYKGPIGAMQTRS